MIINEVSENADSYGQQHTQGWMRLNRWGKSRGQCVLHNLSHDKSLGYVSAYTIRKVNTSNICLLTKQLMHRKNVILEKKIQLFTE